MPGYRDIAADLKRRIEASEWAVGDPLPTLPDLATHYGVARQTIRAAIGELGAAGYVVTGVGQGRRVQVRDRRTVLVPFSRYKEVLNPGGELGPWESACARQGLDGRMVLMEAAEVAATAEVAALLEVDVGTPLIYRRRHATINERIVQIQHVWYPTDLVTGTALAGPGKVVGGAFGLLTAIGHQPSVGTERIRARMPTPAEAAELQTGSRVPLLRIERVVRDATGRVLELLQVIAAADQIELVYDNFPLAGFPHASG